MENDLVTIRRFHFLGEAQVVRGFLESAGIPCFVANQITASHHSCFAGALGGVCLQVRQQDIESAEELLQQADSEGVEELAGDDGDVEHLEPSASKASGGASGTEKCPSCSLGVVSVRRAARECLNCGYRWNAS
jgi:hypothetical protein